MKKSLEQKRVKARSGTKIVSGGTTTRNGRSSTKNKPQAKRGRP